MVFIVVIIRSHITTCKGFIDLLSHLILAAIFTSWPIKKWGISKVLLCGSIITSMGFVASSLAPNVPMLYLTYGIITGRKLPKHISMVIMIQKLDSESGVWERDP